MKVLAVFMVLMALTACAVNPATGRGNLVLMSESREMNIGSEEHSKVLSSMPVLQDEALTAYVNEIGQRLVAGSHRPDLEFTFTVIDSPEINAFALPGGFIYINRGLMAFLNAEDELAAVLAHEIGHVTARHAIQQHARGTLGSTAAGVGGFVAAVATGNIYIGSELAQVGSLWAQAGVSGFGREHELEADSLGAEYLYNAGYNPRAMIDVLSVLKNQEDFNVRVAGRRAGYHGLFATHPRNDTRLQQAIASAGNLPADQVRETDPAVFRQHMDGMVFGERRGSTDRNRYYQDTLGYTMVFPDEWRVSESFSATTAASPSEAARMTVEARRLQELKAPHEFIRDNLGIELQRTEILNQFRLQGFTGVHRNAETGNPERIAVIYLGPRAFVFSGEILDHEREDELDNLLLRSIRSFRAIQGNERQGGSGNLRIRYVQVGENFSWPALAQRSPIPQYAEETLRLLNGYYPRGNPQTGEWIKILQ
jgi:predicted Zn-dependent protease